MTSKLECHPLTKIIATVGPASGATEVLERLIDAGVSIFRLNFSHGRLDDHEQVLASIRSLAAKAERPVGVLGDLQGPKIRLGRIEGNGIDLEAGDEVLFGRQHRAVSSGESSPFRLSTTYNRFIDDVNVGERVLINDGAVRMLVVEKRPDELLCSVTTPGRISSGKGINLPGSNITVDALTDRDIECVRWAVDRDIDFLALSFVRSAKEVLELRNAIDEAKVAAQKPELSLPIIAKVELPAAVANLDGILDQADAVMVARGDLGVEMELARVPVIQKRLIEAAQSFGKPCIVATQMLESMIDAPTPTRAEASDVANAILDGADAVMLSGETAIGRHPVLVVDHICLIALHTEEYLRSLPQTESPPRRLVESRYRTAALAHGVWTIAKDYDARLIIVWSQQGGGARLLSQNNFQIPIVALSSDERALRQMQLYRGVTPVHMNLPRNLAAFTRDVDTSLIEHGWAERGDRCILVAGSPLGVPRTTNSLAIHVVGDPDTGFARQESAG